MNQHLRISPIRLAIGLIFAAVVLGASACGPDDGVSALYPEVPVDNWTDWSASEVADLKDLALEVARLNSEVDVNGEATSGSRYEDWLEDFWTFTSGWRQGYDNEAALDAGLAESATAPIGTESSDDEPADDDEPAVESSDPNEGEDSGEAQGACEAGESDPRIPSIGRTGSAAEEVALQSGMLTEDSDIDTRDLGLAIRDLIEAGGLCAENLILLYEEGVITDQMSAAIMTAIEALGGA